MDQNRIFEASPPREKELLPTLFWTKKGTPLYDTSDNPFLVTVEDLTFEADFKIQAQRSEGVHAFVTHWTCEFTHCHTRTGFDTSPAAPYTHWKVRPSSS